MAININGNHGKGYISHASGGNGIANLPHGMGWVAISSSAAGEVFFGQISDILTGGIEHGVFFQPEADCTVSFTLCNPGLGIDRDPLVQASVLWTPPMALPAGEITLAPGIFTCYKLTFTAPGTVYIGAL